LPRCLIPMLRIRGELVPEPVQVDALASLHEALHVGTAEAEMPDEWTLHDFIPRSDARNRCVEQDEFRDAIRMRRGIREADHVADVVCYERGAVHVQSRQDAGNVTGLRLLVIPTRGVRR